jgi:hypothetical protein
MSKKIVFKVDKNGNALIESVEGFGHTCLDATKFLEHALGSADESSRRLTQEYNEPLDVSEEQHLRH